MKFSNVRLLVKDYKNIYETYQTFLTKGLKFVNQPTDMPDWGMRIVHLRDPEENLIEFFTPLKAENEDRKK